MIWSPVIGAGGATLPLVLAWWALRRLVGAVELVVKVHGALAAERERRATMVAVAAALPRGGSAVHYEGGQPLWELRVPMAPLPLPVASTPAPALRSAV